MIRIEASAQIGRPIGEVFDYVIDPANEPSWDTDVRSTRRVTAGPIAVGSRTEYTFRFMGKDSISVGEVVEFERPNREVIQFGRGMFGAEPRLTYSFERIGDSSTRFTRSAEASGRGIGRLLEPLMKALLGRRNALYVDTLRRRLEQAGPAEAR